MVGNSPIQKIAAIIVILISFEVSGQVSNPQENGSGIRVMFYNVENLFHPSNDSIKNDDEFTKDGTRYWSYKRYKEKLAKTAKTAIAVGGWEPPAIIGLCEIENLTCLEDLIYRSPLKKFGYKIVHEESPDKRGIDVALLYRPDHFDYIAHNAITLQFPEEGSRPSRDILHVQGLVGKDTLHVFVNHWPSRYGGQMATLPKRNFAASVLRAQYDSLALINPAVNFLAMGDFNDHPEDESMHKILRAQKSPKDLAKSDLVNLLWPFEKIKGTHKYQHEWGVLDQFVRSQSLGSTSSGLVIPVESVQIFDADYLLVPENDGVGKKPNRTYVGFKYHGGFSDHLPIYCDVLITKKAG